MHYLPIIIMMCILTASAILAFVFHVGQRATHRADREQNNS